MGGEEIEEEGGLVGESGEADGVEEGGGLGFV